MKMKDVAPKRTVARVALGIGIALVGSILFACVTGGPVGFIPGGTFVGEVERGPEPDWAFAVPLDTVAVQVSSRPPRTVRTGIVVYQGVPYLPVTYAFLKRWRFVVRDNPDVILRADGRLFERTAVLITDELFHAELVEAGQAKYGPPFHASWTPGVTEFFRLDP